jgi:TIGR00252 family protein
VTSINKRLVGKSYERIAGAFLEKQGYQILQYNFYCKIGEIDIIAKHEQTLVFCEVKYRKNLQKGHPFEAITKRKQQIISRCAMYYLTKMQTELQVKLQVKTPDIRFDVIGIVDTQIEWIQGAFEYQ